MPKSPLHTPAAKKSAVDRIEKANFSSIKRHITPKPGKRLVTPKNMRCAAP